MKWIRCTQLTEPGEPIWINMTEATSMQPFSDHTSIVFEKDHRVLVRETPEKLIRQAELAGRSSA